MGNEKDTKANEILTNESSSATMSGGRTRQNVGFMIMLLGVFVAAITLKFSSEAAATEGMILLFALVASLIISGFGFKTLSIVFTSLQIVLYIAIKLYAIIMNGDKFEPLMVAWVLAPAISLFGMTLFTAGIEQMRIGNRVLRQQVEELAILDPLTGLYNLRGLYMDMQTQISYAERNGKAISLMIVKLRYPKEMKAVLKKNQYNKVVKGLSKLICDTVRLEDKVYSIDQEGKFAILLTCDKMGCRLVEGRLRGKIDRPEWLAGISDKPIRGEVKIGYIEYSKDTFNRDAAGFLAAVEEEVEFDV